MLMAPIEFLLRVLCLLGAARFQEPSKWADNSEEKQVPRFLSTRLPSAVGAVGLVVDFGCSRLFKLLRYTRGLLVMDKWSKKA